MKPRERCWQRFWYDSDYTDKAGYYLMCKNKSTSYDKLYSKIYNMLGLSWVTEEEKDFYLSRSSNFKIYSDLKAMIRAGEPVYSPPEQCKFVNEYHKGED